MSYSVYLYIHRWMFLTIILMQLFTKKMPNHCLKSKEFLLRVNWPKINSDICITNFRLKKTKILFLVEYAIILKRFRPFSWTGLKVYNGKMIVKQSKFKRSIQNRLRQQNKFGKMFKSSWGIWKIMWRTFMWDNQILKTFSGAKDSYMQKSMEK